MIGHTWTRDPSAVLRAEGTGFHFSPGMILIAVCRHSRYTHRHLTDPVFKEVATKLDRLL